MDKEKQKIERLEERKKFNETQLAHPFIPYLVANVILFTGLVGGLTYFLQDGDPNPVTHFTMYALGGVILGIGMRAFFRYDIQKVDKKLSVLKGKK